MRPENSERDAIRRAATLYELAERREDQLNRIEAKLDRLLSWANSLDGGLGAQKIPLDPKAKGDSS